MFSLDNRIYKSNDIIDKVMLRSYRKRIQTNKQTNNNTDLLWCLAWPVLCPSLAALFLSPLLRVVCASSP